jgi:type III pantothenate kinase
VSDIAESVIAVDIGNSRMKFGRFESAGTDSARLPEPDRAHELIHTSGQFDAEGLSKWCNAHVASDATWRVASVHRKGAERLIETLRALSGERGRHWRILQLTYQDVPLVIRVDEPARVGIDRLLAALAAERLRRPDRAAVIVDLGTATTVDLLDADGAFSGGAILPGIAMAARALEEQTDALPRIALDHLDAPPAALGKSTIAAIEAGLYWGTIGAVRELVRQLAAGHALPPDVLVTGGASPHVAELLAERGELDVRHVPHLVLAGIALIEK